MYSIVSEGTWAPDSSGIGDVLYAKRADGTFVVGDDFFEVASQVQPLRVHQENLDFFIRHGYFSPGQTFFQEIRRVPVGMRLRIAENRAVEEPAWGQEPHTPWQTYEVFKKELNGVLETHRVSENDALFLSAGVDSGLLAAISAKVFQKTPLAITMSYKQKLKINDIDVIGSRRIAEHLGLEHAAIEFDFDEEHISSLQGFIGKMPLAAHMSLSFLKMSKEAAARKKTKVWCGQNADSVYNMGPTERSLGGPIKRFYLSKEYWTSLPDITDGNRFAFLYRSLGSLGPLAFRLKRGFRLRQPATFAELLHAFEESEEYIALPQATSPENKTYVKRLTYAEAKQMFFDRKAQSFIIGRDPRAVYAAGELAGVQVVLPYSAATMMRFFRGLELGMQDVLEPKRFIYRYLKELLGNQAFRNLYGSQEALLPRISYHTWHEWQKEVLRHTTFWKELQKEIAQNPLTRKIQKDNVYHIIHLYWAQSVLSMIRHE